MADEGVPHTPAGEPWVSNAQFAIGERVYYFSSTHGAWLPAIVLGHNYRGYGIVDTYNLDIRRGASASRLLPGPVARDAEPPECVASSSTSVAANQDHASDVQTEGPQAQTLAEPDQLVPNEAQDREEGEHHEEEVEAESPVSAVESSESSVDVDDRVDAVSFASTQAPGLLPPRGHGRHAPRSPRVFAPPCGCDCHNVPNHLLGPRSRRAQRCACPTCGHRTVEQGQGCHYRVRTSRDFVGMAICPHCQDFCTAFLAWGDIFYAHGAVWNGRELAVRVTSGSSGDVAPGRRASLEGSHA